MIRILQSFINNRRMSSPSNKSGFEYQKETDPSLVSSVTNLSPTMEDSFNPMDSKNDPVKEPKPSDRQYVSSWKDLGGTDLCFYAGGSYHPVQFLRKLTKLFDEAGVPDSARVGLAVSCMEGSAAHWAGYREESFETYSQFVKAFLDRYWSQREQKELYSEIKNGKFNGTGDKADYFLHLAYLSTYLSERIPEEELIELLVDHFTDDPDIRRGVISAGLKTVEEVEDFLRRMDYMPTAITIAGKRTGEAREEVREYMTEGNEREEI